MGRIATLFALVVLSAASGADPVKTLSGFAQGTTWRASVWKAGGVDAGELRARLEAELESLDATLSNYRPDSDIERFNNAKTTDPVRAGPEIVSLVQIAREVSEASRGCYDLTVKPLFDLWGFDDGTLTVPGSSRLAQARQRVGFDKLKTPSPTELRKTSPRIRVDLSSIAQGYSVARLATVIETAGVQNYLVEIGGELQVRGHKPNGSRWRVGIARPSSRVNGMQKVFPIPRNTIVAVATSGTYRRYLADGAKRYSYVLDARTGRPVTHDTVSVTVINDDPTLADAWSTALLCLGNDQGLTVANERGIAALFISQKENRFAETASDAWRSWFKTE